MSKPVKEMIMDDYRERFGDLEGALVIDIRGIDANSNNEFRLGLLKKDIRVSVIRNTLARRAFDGTALGPLESVLEGPSALAYGADSVVDVARAIVDWTKKIKDIELKGAVLDGQLFEGEDGVKRLSEFPTKEEAQAKVVQLVLSPGSKVVGCATSPGSKIMGIVKEIQERLEKGEAISKVA